MKKVKSSLTSLILISSIIFGFTDVSENDPIKELESIAAQTGVFDGKIQLQKVFDYREQAIPLFESLDNKKKLTHETFKVMGVMYLFNGEREKALVNLDRYIKSVPNNGEAFYYKGITLLRNNNEDYCKYFKKAKELGAYDVKQLFVLKHFTEVNKCF